MANKIVLAGGTGFVGSALARHCRDRGWDVIVLTRSRTRVRNDGVREVQWDPATALAPASAATAPASQRESHLLGDKTSGAASAGGEPEKCNLIGYTLSGGARGWAAELEGARAVVNLAGSTINTVHNAANRRRILESRVESVCALGAAVQACRQPPATWVQTSAVGFYGTDVRTRHDESSPAGSGFKAEVCVTWEAAFRAACPAAVRPVVLRVGVVLGRKGGAYPPLARVTKLFLGGAAGGGRQGISWIWLDDLEEIFLRAVENDAMRGTYNACAPEPVSNAEFMRALRESLRRPWSPPVPAWAIRVVAPWVMRTDASLVLKGQFAVPARLEAEGFRFRAARIGPALRALAE